MFEGHFLELSHKFIVPHTTGKAADLGTRSKISIVGDWQENIARVQTNMRSISQTRANGYQSLRRPTHRAAVPVIRSTQNNDELVHFLDIRKSICLQEAKITMCSLSTRLDDMCEPAYR